MNISACFGWISEGDARSLLEELDQQDEDDREEDDAELSEEAAEKRKRKEGYRRFLESQAGRKSGNEHEKGKGKGKELNKATTTGIEGDNNKAHYFQFLQMVSKFNKRNKSYMNLANILVERSELEIPNTRKRGFIKEAEEEERERDPFEMVEENGKRRKL